MRKKKVRRVNKFTNKKHSTKGLLACIMDGISILTFVLVFSKAFKTGGKVGPYVGMSGMAAMLLSLLAIIEAVRGLREESTFNNIPIVGLVFGVLIGLVWIGMIVVANI